MRNKLTHMQSFFKNHPFLFAIFALVVSRILGVGTIKFVQLLRPELNIQNDLGWLLMVMYAGVVVSLVYWTNMADEVGLKKPVSSKEWLIMVPTLSLPIIILIMNGMSSWGFAKNLVLCIAAIGVAVNEEVLFRGILLRGFMKWGPWVAIFLPSTLFALAHATNIFQGGDTTFAIYQTIWTFATGIMLSAMKLRNKSLYPVIVLHILLDGVEYFSTGEYGVHSQTFPNLWLQIFVALNVILAIYAVILFYKSSKLQNQENPMNPAF